MEIDPRETCHMSENVARRCKVLSATGYKCNNPKGCHFSQEDQAVMQGFLVPGFFKEPYWPDKEKLAEDYDNAEKP